MLICNILRRLEWNEFEVTVIDQKTITVRNVTNDTKEKLEFRDRVIKACLGYRHLVVTTPTQCYVYRQDNSSYNHNYIKEPVHSQICLAVCSPKLGTLSCLPASMMLDDMTFKT